MIITIGRECGCDGDRIGKILADAYGLPFYDKKTIIRLSKEKKIYERSPNFFGEKPVNSFLYAIATGECSTVLSKMPKEALMGVIGKEEGVIIGRCANYVYKGHKDTYRIFLTGDKNERMKRIMEKHNITEKEAATLIQKTDEKRATFHKYYTDEVWGYAGNYDLCIDISKVGVEQTIKMIKEYIDCSRI